MEKIKMHPDKIALNNSHCYSISNPPLNNDNVNEIDKMFEEWFSKQNKYIKEDPEKSRTMRNIWNMVLDSVKSVKEYNFPETDIICRKCCIDITKI